MQYLCISKTCIEGSYTSEETLVAIISNMTLNIFDFNLADILKIPAISSHSLKYFVKSTFQATSFA